MNFDSDGSTDSRMISKEKLLKILRSALEQFGEFDKARIKELDQNTIEISGASNVALHSFALRCEQFGSQLAYERQTIIHVQ